LKELERENERQVCIRTEILGLVRNIQELQNAEHPLSRIIDIAETPDRTVVTTTDIHLPRRIGHALEHAFKGKLFTHLQ
jgi:hypothetical protein